MANATAELHGEAGQERQHVNMRLRLAPETHDVLRRIAYERRVSIHSLIMDGVAEVLRQHGK